jgi:hypothetical protein
MLKLHGPDGRVQWDTMAGAPGRAVAEMRERRGPLHGAADDHGRHAAAGHAGLWDNRVGLNLPVKVTFYRHVAEYLHCSPPQALLWLKPVK